MFGASEDRARQLAGRQRWKRISSSGSSSSYRSASSSSQLSQLSHRETSSSFEQNPQRPSPIPEHPSPTHFVSVNNLLDLGGLQDLVEPIAASDVEEAFSRMVSKNLHPQSLHQRTQTEHLSHVLHGETASGAASPPPTSYFAIPGRTKQYGVLGWGAKILQQVRHVTEPASLVQIEGRLSTVVTVHNLNSRSVSSNNINTQSMPSMRGGAGPQPQIDWNAVQAHKLWDRLFNTGPAYRYFMSWLRDHWPDKYVLFISLFGDRYGLEVQPTRQHFLSTLEHDVQQTIHLILEERAETILGSALSGGAQSAIEIQQILQESIQDDGYPAINPRPLFLALVNNAK